MTYALIASVLCGVTGFLEPLDDFARNIRYSLRYVHADGSIVVVGMDQKSVEALGGKYPWPLTVDAALIENLKKAGAGRIVFDRSFSDLDSPAHDAKFIGVLDKFRGDVYFGSGVLNAGNGRIETALVPAPKFIPHVEVATFMQQTNPIGQLAKLYSRTPDGQGNSPAISTVLANKDDVRDLLYRPDFSIRHDTFPTMSAADVVLGKIPDLNLAGKDVIVGVVETAFGDSHYLPGQGRAQGVYAHAIGAQTLKSGRPIDLGWTPAALLAALGALGLLLTQRARNTTAIAATAGVTLAVVPIVLDGRLVSVDVAPAILLFSIVLIQQARLRLGWQKSRTNDSSGLPNVIALREVSSLNGAALIAARIDNHAAITASFAKDVEHVVANEIVGRLKLGDSATTVYQGDEGVYYWLSPITENALLSEHLDGLHALFSQPVAVGDRHVDVAVTFGVDNEPKRAMSSRIGSALLSAEDARRQGKRWKIYDDTRNADAAWQLSLGSEIDRGLASGQFWTAYQPKLDLKTGRIVGAEVLVRWDHPVRGAVSPAEFIPAAERDHRIERLTRFVFQRAMEDAVMLGRTASVGLALNVSVPVLRNREFGHYAVEIVEKFGLAPAQFTLEITESVFLAVDDVVVMDNLTHLARMGFGISIDDFGTGFSTLESLQRVPASEVKIDQTFVKTLTGRATDRIIVQSIIKMAQGLGRKVVAEGVEDAVTLRELVAMGCDQAQGFFIGRPQPIGEFMAFVEARNRRTAA